MASLSAYSALSGRAVSCWYFDPFTKGSSVKNKPHRHSRHLASFLFYGSEGVLQTKQSREIGMSETNLLIVGLVGETSTPAAPVSISKKLWSVLSDSLPRTNNYFPSISQYFYQAFICPLASLPA
jgi:hypothetical protein